MVQISINYAKNLHETGEFLKAADAYELILGKIPELTEVFLMIAEDALNKYQTEIALTLCRRIDLNNPLSHGVLLKLSALFESAKAYNEASKVNKIITTKKPKNAVSWRNLGATLNKARKFDEAEIAMRAAVKLAQNDPIANAYLSSILREKGDYLNALYFAKKAIKLAPDYAPGHILLSELLLSNGKLKQGFKEYEWRLKIDTIFAPVRAIDAPYWNGSKIDGTLLIVGEQGFGDVIQMCRYVALAAKKVNSVILMVHPPLVKLLQSLKRVTVINFDLTSNFKIKAKISIGSLPHIFKTTKDNVPASVPYLFPTLNSKAFWKSIDIPLDSMNVGIGWRGNPEGAADRGRSMELNNFFRLSKIKNINFFSLQKDASDIEIEMWPTNQLVNLGKLINNFDDTAAAIERLDLIITTDTALAHVAGSLGKPVWLLLKKYPSWRWIDGRLDSPWYPTMSLFHQKKIDNWSQVIEIVSQKLKKYDN